MLNSRSKLELYYKIFLAAIVLIIIIQPDIERPLFQFIYENTLWIIFTIIGLGMFFLLIKKENLVTYSLLVAAILTFYLKSISNSDLIYKSIKDGNNSFTIDHYSADDFNNNLADLIKILGNSDADIISIGELAPRENKELKIALDNKYPYHAELNTIDFNSKIILSKVKINKIDTFFLADNPQLKVQFNIKNNYVNILFPYVLPFDVNNNLKEPEKQLEKLGNEALIIKNSPSIIIGEFNQVYWSKDLREFLYKTKLNNVRRFAYAFSNRNPYNHIFFSDLVNCLYFEDLMDSNSERIGLRAKFELSDPEVYSYKHP
jgi:hypothetical protein